MFLLYFCQLCCNWQMYLKTVQFDEILPYGKPSAEEKLIYLVINFKIMWMSKQKMVTSADSCIILCYTVGDLDTRYITVYWNWKVSLFQVQKKDGQQVGGGVCTAGLDLMPGFNLAGKSPWTTKLEILWLPYHLCPTAADEILQIQHWCTVVYGCRIVSSSVSLVVLLVTADKLIFLYVNLLLVNWQHVTSFIKLVCCVSHTRTRK